MTNAQKSPLLFIIYYPIKDCHLQKPAVKYFYIIITDTGMGCDFVPRGLPYYCADTCALAAYFGWLTYLCYAITFSCQITFRG